MESGARCAAHAEQPATRSCYRCGAFTCDACCAAPSVLCTACVARLRPLAGTPWSSVPPRPSLVTRVWRFAPVIVLASLWALAPATFVSPLARWAYPWVYWVVQPVVLVSWFVYLLRHASHSRRYRTARRDLFTGRPRLAAVALETLLREERGVPLVRVAELHAFACALTMAGDHARAIVLGDDLAERAWSRPHRNSARLVTTRAHALLGQLEAAQACRAQVRLGWWRWLHTTADEDGLLAARAARWREAHEHLLSAREYAWLRRRHDLLHWTALVDAFVLERAAAPEAEVEGALAIGRETSPEVVAGLTRDWPELAEFVARRLSEAERPDTT